MINFLTLVILKSLAYLKKASSKSLIKLKSLKVLISLTLDLLIY
jgi:hypothetical protein